ncbi:unnamed protein product [Arabidopsis arenosa]|uniref:Uncharacterized protein n=1 Tax=Arabidopsis arenosa TaxID=38785 RepID=A0A8S2AF14_ARAAE|nr:unnamed protein product [Arabidopsis arenosa]
MAATFAFLKDVRRQRDQAGGTVWKLLSRHLEEKLVAAEIFFVKLKHESYQEFSEVPDLSKWFSSYVYESPMLDTSDGLELSFPGESKGIKDMELVSSQDKDKSQSQVAFSEITEVVEYNEVDEENNSIWGKPKKKRISTI